MEFSPTSLLLEGYFERLEDREVLLYSQATANLQFHRYLFCAKTFFMSKHIPK